MSNIDANTADFVRVSANRTGLRVQLDVVHALIIRELQSKFGGYRLSYVWALLEPMSYVLVFGLAKFFMGRSTPGGVDFLLFLLVGIIPWLAFNGSVARAFDTVSGNQALFQYRMVRPFDAVLARTILEFAVSIVVYVVLLIGLTVAGFDTHVEDPIQLVLLVIPLFCFTLGFCLLGMVAVGINPESKNFIQLPMRGMFWLSGIFYSVDALPAEVHKYLLWNPMLHVLQLNRLAFFEEMDESVVSLEYFCGCAVVFLWLGLIVYRVSHNRLMTKR